MYRKDILSQAKPSQAKPSQAKPSQAKPSQAKPSQAKPSQALGDLCPFFGVHSLKSVLHSRCLHRTKTVSFS